ncbi:lipopolysaccharide biosynthesis protein [Bradyrhizobium hipponense]|uniref:Lipopolysaccharide biosynthesis protein n=1 Tax=Bradyrhizobium hipponense TaxID=2605638 RepID=A0A5S4YKA9_9BRAD|nr:lipopolysaccharide biosynthesis protein [Bradyrhizobium hipponense]TYO60759.1 lipopolysaccharide biosynthesis protein [Bradyrhizobium hipponense]
MDDLKGMIVRGSLARLCGQAANFFLRLGVIAALARLLDPKDFGLVAMTTVVTGVFQLLTTAGLSSATVQKDTITDEQISTLFWVNLLVGMVLALLCAATAPSLVEFYHEPRLFGLTVVSGAGFFLNALAVQHSALLQRQLRYTTLTIIELLSQVVSFAAGVGMAFGGLGYWAILGMTLVSTVVYAVCVWMATGWIPGPPRRAAGLRGMLSFGGTVTLNSLVVYVAYNFEKLLLGRYWGADALGIYERGYRLVNLQTAELNAAIGGVAFSGLSRLQSDPFRLKSYFLKGYSLVLSMTLPVTVFCAVFADDIVGVVLGPKWGDAAVIFRLLTPTILIFGIINPLAWLLYASGLQVRSLKIALVIAPLVISGYLIGLSYGPTGVACAYSAAMILWLIPHILWCLHGTLISPRDLLLAAGRPLVAGTAAAAVALGVKLCLGESESHFWRLLIGGGTIAVIYPWMLLFFMGQKAFYVDLFKELKISVSMTTREGRAG